MVVPVPGPRRCWRRCPRRGSRVRGGRSRGSCRGAGANGASGWRGLAADERGSVVFEAPGRLAATLRDLAAACGGDRAAAVCRELTKLHEQILRGSLGRSRGLGGGRRDRPARRGRHRDRGARGAAREAAGPSRLLRPIRWSRHWRRWSVSLRPGRHVARPRDRLPWPPAFRGGSCTRSADETRSAVAAEGRSSHHRSPGQARTRRIRRMRLDTGGQAATSSPSGMGSSARAAGAADSPRDSACASSEWAAASAS